MKNIKNIFKRFPLKVSWLLWAGLAIIILLDIFTLKRSAGIILNARKAAQPAIKRLVRVDFKTYDDILNKIQSVQNYHALAPTVASPFGLNEKAQQ